jgi:hypothetical protein
MQLVLAHNKIYCIHISRLDLSSRARHGTLQAFSPAAGAPAALPPANLTIKSVDQIYPKKTEYVVLVRYLSR